MRKRLEVLIWFIIDNGPTLLTIGFAAYVIALAQTGPISTDTLLQWVLAILGLLAISELVERLRKLNKIDHTSSQILQTIQGKFDERASADEFFLNRLPPLSPYFEKATEIYLTGTTLQRTIRENLDVLTRRLKDGATIKVLIMDPKGSSIEKLKTTTAGLPDDYMLNNIQLTIQNLTWLSKLPGSKGRIEVRVLDEEPKFNIIAIDIHKEYGLMFIEFYAQRWVASGRPRVELSPKRDGYWFGFFREQFDKIWQDSHQFPL